MKTTSILGGTLAAIVMIMIVAGFVWALVSFMEFRSRCEVIEHARVKFGLDGWACVLPDTGERLI